ncbi:ferrochelatase [Porphyromonas pogonae]|uniref:ferrochelatase n=1 Tax=Porphyromonas pogonae TaxID=867595 RepID=UPI002E76ECCF|nr:ferrochelatase [Porphyromonas pogonae]
MNQSDSSLAILILNMGSPRSPHVKDVKKYLTEFLCDKRIIGLPYLLRQILVRSIIVPRRAKFSAGNYKKIWDDNKKAFPLITCTESIASKLEDKLGIPCHVAMRYGSPGIRHAIKGLARQQNLKKLIVLPLYPQYAMSSYETVVEKVHKEVRRINFGPEVEVIPPYYAHKAYIRAVSKTIEPFLKRQPFDKIIFSFHGIPLTQLPPECRKNYDTKNNHHCCESQGTEHTKETLCYHNHCYTTVQYVAKTLGLKKEQYELAYQSRLGPTQWLTPYMDKRMEQLPGEGIKRILTVCPGFICDCLETLEEIAVTDRDLFLSQGGETCTYIPCLNDTDEWIEAMRSILHPYL